MEYLMYLLMESTWFWLTTAGFSIGVVGTGGYVLNSMRTKCFDKLKFMKFLKCTTALFVLNLIVGTLVISTNEDYSVVFGDGSLMMVHTDAQTIVNDIEFGELIEVNTARTNEGVSLFLEAMIESSESYNMAISQNLENIIEIIQNQGGNEFDEIQYTARMEMENGMETKVMSFTLNAETINGIYEENHEFGLSNLLTHINDLWLLPSLIRE